MNAINPFAFEHWADGRKRTMQQANALPDLIVALKELVEAENGIRHPSDRLPGFTSRRLSNAVKLAEIALEKAGVTL